MDRLFREEKGFTVIEIAVVLVIIGLILASVYKVSEVIKNAHIRNLVNQVDTINQAISNYQSKYRALPGDDDQATVHLGAATVNGNGDGRINVAGAVQEYLRANQHLALAGFIPGSYDGTANPITGLIRHKFGGYIYILDVNGVPGVPPVTPPIIPPFNLRNLQNCRNVILVTNLPADVAEALDRILDDGNPNLGRVQASDVFGAAVLYTPNTTIAYTAVCF